MSERRRRIRKNSRHLVRIVDVETMANLGRLVNITSTAGPFGIGSNVAHCASKAALHMMTVSLARALAPQIRVVSVSPALVEGRYTE